MLWLGLLVVLAPGCAPSISRFNETAYLQAVELKVTSLQLMDKATEEYTLHEKEVEALKTELLKAFEFAGGRPDNDYSTRQWQIMIDPGEHMIGGFLELWKERGTLSEVMIRETGDNISAGFDTIIGLESGKTKRE